MFCKEDTEELIEETEEGVCKFILGIVGFLYGLLS
jgi:hypothetical protein